MKIEVKEGICTVTELCIFHESVKIHRLGSLIAYKKRNLILNAGFSMDSAAAMELAKAIVDLLVLSIINKNKASKHS